MYEGLFDHDPIEARKDASMTTMLALLFCCYADSEWQPPDELTITRLLFSAQNDDRVALSFFSNGMFKLAIYDFNRNQAVTVKDGRVNPSIAFPIPWRKGFAVVNTVGGQAFLLGPDGAFIEKLSWDKFEDWDADFKLVYLSPMPENNRAVATIKLKASEKYILGIMDFEKKRLELCHDKTLRDENLSLYWLRHKLGWLEVTPQTGAVVLLDASSFKQIRSLNPAREPWQTSKRYRKGIYAKVLDLPVTDGTTVYFKWNQYRDHSMQPLKEVKVRTLALTGDKAKETDLYILGTYQGKSLGFSWEAEELKLIQP